MKLVYKNKSFSSREDQILNAVGIVPIDKVHTPGELDKDKVLEVVPKDWYCYGAYFGYKSIAREIYNEVKKNWEEIAQIGNETFRKSKLYKATYKGTEVFIIMASGASADYLVICAELKFLKNLLNESIEFYKNKFRKFKVVESKLPKINEVAKEAGFARVIYKPSLQYASYLHFLGGKISWDDQFNKISELVPVVNEILGDEYRVTRSGASQMYVDEL